MAHRMQVGRSRRGRVIALTVVTLPVAVALALPASAGSSASVRTPVVAKTVDRQAPAHRIQSSRAISRLALQRIRSGARFNGSCAGHRSVLDAAI